jgi:hypothetical protein
MIWVNRTTSEATARQRKREIRCDHVCGQRELLERSINKKKRDMVFFFSVQNHQIGKGSIHKTIQGYAKPIVRKEMPKHPHESRSGRRSRERNGRVIS